MQRSDAYWKTRQECLEQGFREGRDLANKEIAIAAFQEGCSPELIRKLTDYGFVKDFVSGATLRLFSNDDWTIIYPPKPAVVTDFVPHFVTTGPGC
jgi:hypothetical protein